jgi:hypothetical protein
MVINGVLGALTSAESADTAKVYLSPKTAKRDSKLSLCHADLFIGLTIFACPIVVKDNVDLTMLLREAGLTLPYDLHQVFVQV